MAHEQAEVLAAQLGRPLRGSSRVVSRCALKLPVVIQTHPALEDGRPFPTLYYLTCPLARARISRLEGAGWVRALTARLDEDPAFRAGMAAADKAYAEERASLLPPDSPQAPLLRGGVGGAVGGLKCLHAHYAHRRAGGENPAGAWVAERIEPLDCASPCVVDGARNPAWREPGNSKDVLDPGPPRRLS